MKECIRLIEYGENKVFKYNLRMDCYQIEMDKLYDVAIKNNNIEAFNILLDWDYEGEYLPKKFEFFNSKQLKISLNKGFIPTTNFINLIINRNGNEGATLLKVIFQHLNFNNNFVLYFLINYYWNKNPLTKIELNTIINDEYKKVSETLNDSYRDKPLIIACYNEYDAIVKILIENGANVNVTKNKIFCYTETPLSIVCENGNESIVEYLVKHGADVNIKLEENNYFRTPLSIACRKGYESIVEYLIEQGANVNAEKNEYDYLETPLSISCENGDEFIVKYLVEHGADVNVEINSYDSIKPLLCIACENGEEFIVKYLVEYGANVNKGLKSHNSFKTPLSIVCESGDEFLIKYFVEHGAIINVN